MSEGSAGWRRLQSRPRPLSPRIIESYRSIAHTHNYYLNRRARGGEAASGGRHDTSLSWAQAKSKSRGRSQIANGSNAQTWLQWTRLPLILLVFSLPFLSCFLHAMPDESVFLYT